MTDQSPPGERREPTNPALAAIRKHWGFGLAKHVLTAIVGAVMSYFAASSESERAAKLAAQSANRKAEQATVATAQVDDKVRSGYQVTRKDVEALKARIARLERALKAVKVPVPASAPSTPLPTTVEKAVEQVREPKP